MQRFGLVFKHYFMRLMKDKLGLGLQIILPLFIILFMLNTADEYFLYVGQAWAMVISNFVISFSSYVVTLSREKMTNPPFYIKFHYFVCISTA